VKILSFQATSVYFLSKNTLIRLGSDVVKLHAWGGMLIEIKTQETALKSTEDQWRDMKYEEEYELQVSQHEQHMKRLCAIEEEVARVCNVIEQTQKDKERQKLLKLLFSVDPSSNYNSARRDHAHSTSQWLVNQSSDFEKWEKDANSLLWLHGAAGARKSFLR
jgi:hypothetical protein